MNKVLDIKEEIINQRTGVHILSLNLEDVLKKQIDKFKREGLFIKYNMSYVINNNDGDIALVLYKAKSFDEMIKI